jgi:hypothetical protein
MSSPTDAYSVSLVYEVQYGDGSTLSRGELIDKRVYFINLQPAVSLFCHSGKIKIIDKILTVDIASI